MNSPTREQVAVALFTLLQTMEGAFSTYSRRPALWNQTTAMPALFLGQIQDDYEYKNGTATPAHITMQFGLWIYGNFAEDPNVIPDTAFNSLLDLLDTTMGGYSINGQPQTLGNIVSHAWIEGPVHRAPGWLNGQGEIFLVVKVLVPS
jgi:hypothetical protein